MPTREELEAQLDALRQNRATQVLALEAANTALADAREAQHQADVAILAATEAIASTDEEISLVEDQLKKLHRALSGWWGSGSMFADVAALEKMLPGLKPDIVRTRGGEGQFGDPWVSADSIKAASLGYIPSLQIQPKSGRGPKRRGVGSDRILRGDFDGVIRAGLREYHQLPAGLVCPVEIISEVNVQQGTPESQPDWGPIDPKTGNPTPGTPSEYGKLLRYFHGLAIDEGVRDRMLITVTMGARIWNMTKAGAVNTWTGPNVIAMLRPLVGDGVVDLLAADGYSGGDFPKHTPAFVCGGVRKAAASLGIEWSVMETGVVDIAAAKAKWYRDYLKELDDSCYAIVINIARELDKDTLDFRPWVPNGSLQGFVDLMGVIGRKG